MTSVLARGGPVPIRSSHPSEGGKARKHVLGAQAVPGTILLLQGYLAHKKQPPPPSTTIGA